MTPAELEAQVGAGDTQAVLAAMRDLSEKERRVLAPTAMRLEKSSWKLHSGQLSDKKRQKNLDVNNAACAAVLASAAPSEMLDRNGRVCWDADMAFAAFTAREPPWLRGWAEWIVAKNINRWALAHRLVTAGYCDRPTSDNWCLGFLQHAGSKTAFSRDFVANPTVRLGDAAFMRHEFWRLFEIEGTAQISWTLIDRFMFDQRLTWSIAILENAERIGRARLLDATLSALARDFIQFRASWFLELHRDLAPTAEERRPRTTAYLALLASRNPPTVSFALDALGAIEKAGALSAGALAAHVAPALQSRAKKNALIALRLLEQTAPREPTLSGRLAGVAAEALAHEAVDVQTRAVAIVTKLGDRGDAALVDRVRALAGIVAATLRPQLRAWLGGPAEPKPAAVAAPATETARRPTSHAEPLARAGSLDEAIDLLAGAIERFESPDEMEGALAAVASFCGERPADFGDRLGPLAKRARKLLDANREFVVADLRGDLCRLTLAWHGSGDAPVANDDRSLKGLLARRVREVALRAAAARPTTLLATPTHRDGWIDPDIAASRALSATPDPEDAVQSLLRLARDGRQAALARTGAVPGEYGAALRFALGGDRGGSRRESDLWLAAEAARNADNLAPRFDLLTHPMVLHAAGEDRSFAKSEALAMRWAATVFPIDLQSYFRAGGSAIIAGLQERHALWWNPVYLEPLLRSDVPLEPNARRLLAAALASPQAAEAGLATDVLIQIVADERSSADEVGDAFAVLLSAEVAPRAWGDKLLAALRADKLIGAPIRCARWAKRLQDAARASPCHTTFVRDLIIRGLRGLPAPPPGDLAALLILLRELCAETGATVGDPEARAKLAAIGGGGQAAGAARALLGG